MTISSNLQVRIAKVVAIVFVLNSLAFGVVLASPTVTDEPGGVKAYNDLSGGVKASNPVSSKVFTLQNPLKVNSLGELVKVLVEIFSYLAVLFGVVALVWVGFQYIYASARGDSGKIKELHSWLMWIVVGLAVVIAARVIVDVVINTLSATGAVSEGVIKSARDANR